MGEREGENPKHSIENFKHSEKFMFFFHSFFFPHSFHTDIFTECLICAWHSFWPQDTTFSLRSLYSNGGGQIVNKKTNSILSSNDSDIIIWGRIKQMH